ncbi:glycosyltransferase family 2 protein [Devosia sp. BSSL-BM10]|uniref:Glycosyltransferase family 2 protein n=1 Tax=Devosia litorisediminis TaxID=2829817 RepID=A0A942EAH7_9HYPH|nr:glycosyltransferase [Devosia litorisediminis]MBS3848834.1 glycosyltransferase family 2 protein [Devosia litorisediminis]
MNEVDLIALAITIGRGAAWVIVFVALAQSAIYVFQLIAAAIALASRPPVARSAVLWHRYSEVAPPIALIVPAFNEQANVVESVRSLMALEYPNYEVLVVNDGSKDDTLQCLIDAFGLEPVERAYEAKLEHEEIRGIYSAPSSDRLIVVDKFNGGKADAQNAGINVSRAPLFCIIDGDSVLEADALIRAAQPYIEDPIRTVAVGGTIRIVNNSVVDNGRVTQIRLPNKILPLFQVVEYLRAFLMARLAWSHINTLMLVSGAFGMFRRREAVAVGGYTKGSAGEDLDIVIKLHRYMIDNKRRYRIVFIPEPVCWTEAPESLAVLSRQRARWQRGALEAFFRYRHMALNPRYGRVGILGFGQMLIVDVLGPIAEVIGYFLVPLLWLLGVLDTDFLLAYTALVFVFGVFVSVASLVLEEVEIRRFPRARDLAVLTAAAVLENFGYRQLNNFWRIKGYWQYIRSENDWGEMTRTGFTPKD